MEQKSKFSNLSCDDHSIESQETSSLSNRHQTLLEGRVSNLKPILKTICKRARSKRQPYMKISHVNLQRLKLLYSKNIYPNKYDFIAYAKELGIPAIKIENWFKHRRRSQISKGVNLPPPPVVEPIDPSKTATVCETLIKELKKAEELSSNQLKATFRLKLITDSFEAKSLTLPGVNDLTSQDSNGACSKNEGHYKHLIWISGPDMKDNICEAETEAAMTHTKGNQVVNNNGEIINTQDNTSATTHIEPINDLHRDKMLELRDSIPIPCIKQYVEEPFISQSNDHIIEEQQRHIDYLNDRLFEMDQELRDLLLENHYLKNALARERGISKGKPASYTNYHSSQHSPYWNNAPPGYCVVTSYVPTSQIHQRSPQNSGNFPYYEPECEKPIDT